MWKQDSWLTGLLRKASTLSVVHVMGERDNMSMQVRMAVDSGVPEKLISVLHIEQASLDVGDLSKAMEGSS